MLARFALFGIGCSLVTACVVRERDHDDRDDVVPDTADSFGGDQTDSGIAPILVQVDTGKTMSATAGGGVGVFAEYASGGQWHIWWTCDTNLTNKTCDFDVTATANSGAISDVTVQGTSGATPTTTPSSVSLSTTTAATIDGLYFDTSPQAVITLDASLGGQRAGSLFFFVQDDLPNGGYTGTLTDPLELQGSTP